jgi:DNA-binding IclR family transcriptional regulator
MFHDVEHFGSLSTREDLTCVNAQTGTQAVDRAAALLVRVVEADGPVSFGAITEAAGLPKSTTSRLLGALERHALVERDRDGALRPGVVLSRFARRAGSTDRLVQTARPFLESLARQTGETVNLAVAGPGAVEQIDQVDSSYLLGATNWVGLDVPFHCSALGKVFLAHGAVQVPPGRLEQRTTRTVTTREALSADLDLVLRRGYAVADEELEPGLVAIAAPVRDGAGRVVGALSVSGPSVRLTAERTATVAGLTVLTAGQLSQALGHEPGTHPRPEHRAGTDTRSDTQQDIPQDIPTGIPTDIENAEGAA